MQLCSEGAQSVSGLRSTCLSSRKLLQGRKRPRSCTGKRAFKSDKRVETDFVKLIVFKLQHSIDCGAGTAIFLAINSSTIIVIRGKRACLWGSVYLDAFGEEDRELK